MTIVSDFLLYGVEEHQIDNLDNLTLLDAGTGNNLKLQLYAPVITFGGLTVPGTIFATGETDPTSGDGVAIYHNGTQNYIVGYNYTSAAYEQLLINGNPLDLNTLSNDPVVTGSSYFITGGGVQVAGSTLLNLGSQVEIFFTGVSGPGNVRAYNENGAAYLVLDVDGSTLNLNSVSNGSIATGTGLVTAGGRVDVSQAIRALGATIPATGAGLELYYTPGTTTAQIRSYDESGAAYKYLYIDAFTLYLNPNSHGDVYTYGTQRPQGDLAHAGSHLGFFNHAVSAQQSATGAAAGYAAGTTAATFHSDDTYTGNSGTTKYTINGIVAALKAYGLLVA